MFEDAFETDTSANWTVKADYIEGNAADDYSVDWAFDYGQVKYKLYRSATDAEPQELAIPPAPNSKGSTRGIRVAVNKKNDEAARFSVNLYPKGQSFSGDYVLKFDLFLAHGAWADTGVGTTEYAMFGINHSGDYANWFILSGATMSSAYGTTVEGRKGSDGVFFGMTGEGGAARDFVSAEGAGSGAIPVPRLADASGGLLDRNGNGAVDVDDSEGYFNTIFPAGKFEFAGMPSKRWVQVEVSQVGSTVTWKVDGHVIARRENTTAFKSGTIMLGYSDPFNSIADPREETFALFDNVRVEAIRSVVVDTADNASPAGDGKTSLKEALTGLQANDVIKFNIPGAGPHVIKTPMGGYPLITAPGVVIDGYSQPGSSPNTLPVAEGNNAVLKIVLDSTSDASEGTAGLPNRPSTRLPFSGYGDSENGILSVYEADFVTVRGLSFVARHSAGSDEDPSIYCVALVKAAENCRVQGCWFGVAPDGKTVQGAGSAVAAFRHRVNVDGVNVDTYSGGLIYGSDSDGLADLAERNVAVGMHLTLALELPYNRVHGNYFNLLPDAKTFVSPLSIHEAQIAGGRSEGDSVENYENGRQTDLTVIGTDGDGVNDANEANVFGHVKYDHLLEFYSNANGLVVAGNYFGVAPDGTTLAPVMDGIFPNLMEIPGTASLRLGSNGDKVSDALEGNRVHGVPGNQMAVAGAAVLVSARGNTFSGNGFDAFPWFDSGARAWETYYQGVLVDSTAAKPTLTSLANGVLSGKIPARNTDVWVADYIDVYVIDPLSEAKGFEIPGRYLGTLLDDNTDAAAGLVDANLNPGEFAFDISSLNPPPASKVAIAVTYSMDAPRAGEPAGINRSDVGRSVTGPLSSPVLVPGQPNTPIRVTSIKTGAGNSAVVTWTGGTAPFKVQSRTAVDTGAWADVATTSERTATVTVSGSTVFLRVAGQ